MGSYLDIIYCIILFAFTIYNANVIYRNYKHGTSFGTGYSKVVDIFGTIFLVTGSIFITSYRVVIVPLILIALLYQLGIVLLKHHNKTNHSGDTFLFLQNELRKVQIRVWIMLALLFVCVIFTYFELKHYYG